MKKLIIIFSFLYVTIHTVCVAEEFIYPVAKIDEKNIFIVHQTSLDDIGLFLWNIDTKMATKELSSMFLPSHIKLLPDKKGFSFIDRGRIRIKMFQKRTPKAIDIFEPIGSIISMCWIDENQFYGVSKYLQHYKVFLYDISKNTEQLYQVTDFDSIDYLYPVKIDSSLFCIIKEASNVYHVSEQEWIPTLYETPRKNNPQAIMYSSIDPLCFLCMKSITEGYFLKCNLCANISEHLLSFSCCHCQKEGTSWKTEILFTFTLPKEYIIGDSQYRVFESIYPFLPNYDDEDYIYFVDYNESIKSCNVYTYFKGIKTVQSVSFTKKSLDNTFGYFAPVVLQKTLFLGIILPSKKSIHLDQETGFFHIDLPMITI